MRRGEYLWAEPAPHRGKNTACVRARVWVGACASVFVHVCVCACVCVRVYACMPASMHTHTHTHTSKRLEETRDKKMAYYTIELDAGKGKELTKLAITAQQLFVIRVEVLSAQDEALVAMAKQALASFQVKPYSLENFLKSKP